MSHTYTVVPGDTLTLVAKKLKKNVQDLLKLNSHQVKKINATIDPGTTLIISPPPVDPTNKDPKEDTDVKPDVKPDTSISPSSQPLTPATVLHPPKLHWDVKESVDLTRFYLIKPALPEEGTTDQSARKNVLCVQREPFAPPSFPTPEPQLTDVELFAHTLNEFERLNTSATLKRGMEVIQNLKTVSLVRSQFTELSVALFVLTANCDKFYSFLFHNQSEFEFKSYLRSMVMKLVEGMEKETAMFCLDIPLSPSIEQHQQKMFFQGGFLSDEVGAIDPSAQQIAQALLWSQRAVDVTWAIHETQQKQASTYYFLPPGIELKVISDTAQQRVRDIYDINHRLFAIVDSDATVTDRHYFLSHFLRSVSKLNAYIRPSCVLDSPMSFSKPYATDGLTLLRLLSMTSRSEANPGPLVTILSGWSGSGKSLFIRQAWAELNGWSHFPQELPLFCVLVPTLKSCDDFDSVFVNSLGCTSEAEVDHIFTNFRVVTFIDDVHEAPWFSTALNVTSLKAHGSFASYSPLVRSKYLPRCHLIVPCVPSESIHGAHVVHNLGLHLITHVPIHTMRLQLLQSAQVTQLIEAKSKQYSLPHVVDLLKSWSALLSNPYYVLLAVLNARELSNIAPSELGLLDTIIDKAFDEKREENSNSTDLSFKKNQLYKFASMSLEGSAKSADYEALPKKLRDDLLELRLVNSDGTFKHAIIPNALANKLKGDGDSGKLQFPRNILTIADVNVAMRLNDTQQRLGKFALPRTESVHTLNELKMSYQAITEQLKSSFPENNLMFLRSHRDYAILLRSLGEFADAREALHLCRKGCEAMYGSSSWVLASIMKEQADTVYSKAGGVDVPGLYTLQSDALPILVDTMKTLAVENSGPKASRKYERKPSGIAESITVSWSPYLFLFDELERSIAALLSRACASHSARSLINSVLKNQLEYSRSTDLHIIRTHVARARIQCSAGDQLRQFVSNFNAKCLYENRFNILKNPSCPFVALEYAQLVVDISTSIFESIPRNNWSEVLEVLNQDTLCKAGPEHLAVPSGQQRQVWLKEAHGVQKRILGETSLIAARTYLSQASYETGQQRRVDMMLEVLKVFQSYYKDQPSNPEISSLMSSIGSAYGDLGKLQLQKDYFEQALTLLEARYGFSHTEVAKALANLANAYGALGEATKQKALLERALSIDQQILGPNHPDVGRIMTSLAKAVGQLGDQPRRKQYLVRALEILDQHYGYEHHFLIPTLLGLGDVCGILENPHDQRKYLERALHIQKQVYGEFSLEYARGLAFLAGSHSGAREELEKKRELLEKSLDIQRKLYGGNHLAMASSLTNLGTTMGLLSVPELQYKYLSQAYDLQNEANPHHRDTAYTRCRLAELLCADDSVGLPAEQKEEALKKYQPDKLFEQAVPVYQRSYGPKHAVTIRTTINWAAACAQTSQQRKAIQILEDLYSMLSQDIKHPDLKRILLSLHSLYHEVGDQERQENAMYRHRQLVEAIRQ